MNNSYREINKQYTAWLNTLGFSSGVVHNYTHRITDFFTWLNTQSVSQINQVNQKHITTYFNYLESRPNKRHKGRLLSVSHLNHNFIAVDKLLEFLHAQGLQNVPPPTNYRIRVDKTERIRKIETLTQSEVKILHGAIENTYPKLNFAQKEQKH